MSSKQFETFLADSFIKWTNASAKPGFRYQFKSPNLEYSRDLFDALLDRTKGKTLAYLGQHLPYLVCERTKIIPVLHHEEGEGFTENFISHLRDQIAGQNGVFSNAALFVIHNSMLDTLINSATDVSTTGNVWHPKLFAKQLEALIQPASGTSAILHCLLDDQLKLIIEEGSTVFGFKPLFESLYTEKLDLEPLGLFNDPFLLTLGSQRNQARNRIDENRRLREEIEEKVEHYADNLEPSLQKFSPKFIKEHFVDKNDWRTLDFEVYLQALRSNKTQGLNFERIEAGSANVLIRTKSGTKSGQKDQSVIIEVPPEDSLVNLEFVFQGNDLQEEQVVFRGSDSVQESLTRSVSRLGGKSSRARFEVPFAGTPTYFSVDVKRNNASEEYKFKCLLLRQGAFFLNEIKNCFRVEPKAEQVTLQIEENTVRVASLGDHKFLLQDDQGDVDCNEYAVVDFEDQATKSELIQFSIVSGQDRLKINIEGVTPQESITIPILFERERVARLFQDDANAEYQASRHKVIFENAEYTQVGTRQQLLDYELEITSNALLAVSDESANVNLCDILEDFPKLHEAYKALFSYYQEHKTLPSLVAWGPGYRVLVKEVLDSFESEVDSIEIDRMLSLKQKKLIQIGRCKKGGKERLSPLHPLILAYHLNLVSLINEEKDAYDTCSFSLLPDVTLNRLYASGLMPFVAHPNHGFAHITPVRENRFWLDVVPQKEVSHSFIRRLVKDKLSEFLKAYERIFPVGNTNPLIINAIHLGHARELLLGVVDHFKKHREKAVAIHVNLYDDKLQHNEFDSFAATRKISDLKTLLELTSSDLKTEADLLIDLVRGRLTYSKFQTPRDGQALKYAHLAFFRNNSPIERTYVRIGESLSGVMCDGLIAGEAAETQGDSYFTSFGLRNVDLTNAQHLRLAQSIGALWEPSVVPNAQYHGLGIGLTVSTDFKSLLGMSYDSALWTTIIDPKVTLDFFTAQKDIVLIHYSDQYTSSAGYDAITVTRQVDLFKHLLTRAGDIDTDRLLSEFNAFNGEWLLRMLTAQEKDRKEKYGIIGAYKFVSAMLKDSGISWVPLSVAEIIRVSGNIGLRMSDSEFSRTLQGYRKGAISDDVLFVGFKDKKLYLLPLEVKTGSHPDFQYAGQQALELGRYLKEEILGQKTFASHLYRALFIRQVLMQIEKLQLYQIIDDSQLSHLLETREWWLQGHYQINDLSYFADGIVLAHIESDKVYAPVYERKGNLIQIQLPYALLPQLISADVRGSIPELLQTCSIPDEYFLKNHTAHSHHTSLREAEIPAPLSPLTSSDVSVTEGNPSPSPTASDQLEKMETVKRTPSDEWPLKVLIGSDPARNKPFYWEPTNTAKFMNTNTGIIGTMGTGKTQFTKSLVAQLVRNSSSNVDGAPIGLLIFDYKSDYVDESFLRATSAKRLQLHRLPYNPLSLFGDMPMLPVHTARGLTETMAKAFGLGQKQQLRLRTLIQEAYENAGILQYDRSTWGRSAPTLASVWELFTSQEKVEEDSLYAALESLASLEIFEPDVGSVTSLYDLLDGVTVIELAGYPTAIQNLVVALTLDLFYSQMQKRGKPIVRGDFRQITKMVLVDEADDLMKQDFPSLRKILKEGREYGVGMILSTQEITHFKTSENNYAAYILTWIIHRVAEIKNADIKAIFNKDDKGTQEELMATIRQLEKHFSLYIDGDKRICMMRDKPFWELLESFN